MAYYLAFDGNNDIITTGSAVGGSFGDRENTAADWTLDIDCELPNTGLFRWFDNSGGTDESLIRASDGLVRLTLRAGQVQFSLGGGVIPTAQRITIRFQKIPSALLFRFFIDSGSGFVQYGGDQSSSGVTQFNWDVFGKDSGTSNRFSGDLYGITYTANASAGVSLTLDPSASNGTGLVLPDTVGTNDAALGGYNPPNDDSQWVFYGAAGVTLNGAFNLPALTVQSNGSASLPQPSISGSFSLPLLTVAANSSATLPQPIVNGSFNLPLLSVNGSVTASLPQPNITGAFSLPLLTVSGTASATTTSPEIAGAFNLPTLTISGSASASLPQPNISGAFSLPMLTVQGTGSALVPQPIINGNITLPKLTISGSGSVTLPQPIANGAFNLPLLNVLSFATVSGLEIIIDKQANINQKFLSANVNQEFLSANIKQRYLSNNITYN
jgi:hypothetical protein